MQAYVHRHAFVSLVLFMLGKVPFCTTTGPDQPPVGLVCLLLLNWAAFERVKPITLLGWANYPADFIQYVHNLFILAPQFREKF